MEKQKIEIKRGKEITEYPNGNKLEMDYICDICYRANYPIFMWKTEDDPGIMASICANCATEMMLQDAIGGRLSRCWPDRHNDLVEAKDVKCAGKITGVPIIRD